jgi:hypothetical protein
MVNLKSIKMSRLLQGHCDFSERFPWSTHRRVDLIVGVVKPGSPCHTICVSAYLLNTNKSRSQKEYYKY